MEWATEADYAGGGRLKTLTDLRAKLGSPGWGHLLAKLMIGIVSITTAFAVSKQLRRVVPLTRGRASIMSTDWPDPLSTGRTFPLIGYFLL